MACFVRLEHPSPERLAHVLDVPLERSIRLSKSSRGEQAPIRVFDSLNM